MQTDHSPFNEPRIKAKTVGLLSRLARDFQLCEILHDVPCRDRLFRSGAAFKETLSHTTCLSNCQWIVVLVDEKKDIHLNSFRILVSNEIIPLDLYILASQTFLRLFYFKVRGKFLWTKKKNLPYRDHLSIFHHPTRYTRIDLTALSSFFSSSPQSRFPTLSPFFPFSPASSSANTCATPTPSRLFLFFYRRAFTPRDPIPSRGRSIANLSGRINRWSRDPFLLRYFSFFLFRTADTMLIPWIRFTDGVTGCPRFFHSSLSINVFSLPRFRALSPFFPPRVLNESGLDLRSIWPSFSLPENVNGINDRIKLVQTRLQYTRHFMTKDYEQRNLETLSKLSLSLSLRQTSRWLCRVKDKYRRWAIQFAAKCAFHSHAEETFRLSKNNRGWSICNNIMSTNFLTNKNISFTRCSRTNGKKNLQNALLFRGRICERIAATLLKRFP